MSVESKNSKLAQKPNGDKKSTGLTSRMDTAPKELNGLRDALAQQRTRRDTTNHSTVELSSSGARMGAIKRRLAKSRPPKISDSGSPDDGGGNPTDGFASDTGAATA